MPERRGRLFASDHRWRLARFSPTYPANEMIGYLAYVATRIDWSKCSARILFGRDTAHVIQLICKRLNADAFDKLSAVL